MLARISWPQGLLAALCTLFVSAVSGQTDPSLQRLENSPRHHEWMEISVSEDRTLSAFVVYPQVDGPRPVVIVIHENRGLNTWARGVADQLAEAGYVAIAPDLLSHLGPDGGGTDSFASADTARDALYKLNPEQVTSNLKAVAAKAKTLEAGNGKVAVAGFCWGGGQTFRFATNCQDLSAAFVFYGPAPEESAGFARIACPVYGFYGGNDFRITGQVSKVSEAMKQAGKTFEPVTYEKAGHGFFRSGESPDGPAADRTARDAAWTRLKELLGKL